MRVSVSQKVDLEMQTCIVCGVEFGLPARLDDEFRKDHRLFYCPNGHQQYYPQETEEERLRKKVRFLKDDIAIRINENAELSKNLDGALGKITDLKKRAKAGLCSKCRRHFANLKRHMDTKHPEGC